MSGQTDIPETEITMKRIQVITAVVAAVAGTAIAWALPLPGQASLPGPIQVKASSACVCPHAAQATIASIGARLQRPTA